MEPYHIVIQDSNAKHIEYMHLCIPGEQFIGELFHKPQQFDYIA